ASGSSHGALNVTPLEFPGLVAAGDHDRVLQTASDRPREDTLPPLPDPAADHGDGEQARRRADVEEKQRRVAALLEATSHDAVVLGRADSIAWFTAGGDLGQCLGSEAGAVLLYINRNSRAVVTDNVHSARVFEEEVAGLGFQLKERSWFDEPGKIIVELGHNRRFVSDLGPCPCPWTRALEPLRALRWPMTVLERRRLRELGRTLTLAVEATCRNFVQGESEADVAGHLAHRLLREAVVPVDLRVSADDRPARYRRPTFKAAPIQHRATITVTGRRHGLCASVTRTVSFGPVDQELRARLGVAAMVDATCIYFSRPGERVAGIFRRARRIFEKFGYPHEWTLDYLGFIVGYTPREALLRPDSPLVLTNGMAVHWCPSVGPVRSGDTLVADARGFELITASRNWPQLDVAVRGFVIPRPGILER
ncbi:MAG: M24 family metallopeptidase, partial [Planctomycetaceae bacterium]|nr:M24 family metallopeptidase [Planctomycetaceae bacterium]